MTEDECRDVVTKRAGERQQRSTDEVKWKATIRSMVTLTWLIVLLNFTVWFFSKTVS